MAHLEFWFEFASTYSYLAAARIDAVSAAQGVHVTYHPFLLGPTFAAQGLNTSPFNAYPIKGKYMWRDMERLCEEYALPFKRPSEFPRNGLRAARIALANIDKPWLGRFVRAVYVANFAEDRDIARSEVLRDILADLELSADSAEGVLEAAASPEVKQGLREQTARAETLGIFGAPSFVVDGELFWGHDRLPQAIAWAKSAER